VGAGDGVAAKPEPDVVVHACEALGVPVSSVLVVGDSVFDEKAASKAGARFAGYRMPSKVTVQSLSDVLRLVRQQRP
jgi:phosphoglycolate phosphatase-like HAD superfamily hydrolase